MHVLTNVTVNLRLPDSKRSYLASWDTAEGTDVQGVRALGFSIRNFL